MPQKSAIFAKTAPHSRRSPPAAWKESLRKACLDRARQRWMHKDQQQEHNYTANQIIAWEMQQKGVSVTGDSAQDDKDWQRSHDGFCMTEEEWIDLLDQVEGELERIRNEQEIEQQDDYLDHQIASYEASQHDSGTICPICWDGRLTLTPGNDIVCPNHMGGSCSMRLPVVTVNGQGSLQLLRETLQQTIQHHSLACHGPVSFQLGPDGTCLIANCSVCGGSQHIRI